MENLIDSDDLSKRLGGVSRRTLDQWAYLGTGPRFVKIGRHRRYDPRDVEAWIENRKHGGVQVSMDPPKRGSDSPLAGSPKAVGRASARRRSGQRLPPA
jgi:predicted DNA-binding transcriptional regulator AlpA